MGPHFLIPEICPTTLAVKRNLLPTFRLGMRLSRLIGTRPQTRSVFAAHGLGQPVNEETLKAIGPFLTLETALLSHGIAPGLS